MLRHSRLLFLLSILIYEDGSSFIFVFFLHNEQQVHFPNTFTYTFQIHMRINYIVTSRSRSQLLRPNYSRRDQTCAGSSGKPAAVLYLRWTESSDLVRDIEAYCETYPCPNSLIPLFLALFSTRPMASSPAKGVIL